MFERVSLLLNDEDLNKFRNSNVLLVGLGGVGGACFEASRNNSSDLHSQ